MRPHRAFSPGLTGVLPLRETRHLVEVLRARVGDRFTVFDGEREARALDELPRVGLAVEAGGHDRAEEEQRPPELVVGDPVGGGGHLFLDRLGWGTGVG